MSKTPPLTPERLDLAFRATALRKDLDAVLGRHGAKLRIGWEGKWMVLQVHFPEIDSDEALTLIRADKRGKVRYFTEAEENGTTRITDKLDSPAGATR